MAKVEIPKEEFEMLIKRAGVNVSPAEGFPQSHPTTGEDRKDKIQRGIIEREDHRSLLPEKLGGSVDNATLYSLDTYALEILSRVDVNSLKVDKKIKDIILFIKSNKK